VSAAITLAGGALNLTANNGGSLGKISVNAGITTNGGNISLAGITTVAAAINAGTGNITLTDNIANAFSGGIILNSGGTLTGYDITLHSNPGIDGAQIRLNSGSQITASHSLTLQDDSTLTPLQDLGSTGFAGVELNSGAALTTPTLTVQTGGGTY